MDSREQIDYVKRSLEGWAAEFDIPRIVKVLDEVFPGAHFDDIPEGVYWRTVAECVLPRSDT